MVRPTCEGRARRSRTPPPLPPIGGLRDGSRLPPMTDSPRPLRLKQMQPRDIATALRRDARLLLPVGTCESHGAHLPLGCDTIIIDRIVDDLSAELGILRAPTFEYGVNVPHEV